MKSVVPIQGRGKVKDVGLRGLGTVAEGQLRFIRSRASSDPRTWSLEMASVQ
jgi:hypothetical protein